MKGNTSDRVRTMVLGGLLSALVLGATLLRVTPTPRAYFHLGEAVIYATAIVFGPWFGGVAGAIGSAIADLISGYAFWMPITVVVKGIEGYVVGRIGHEAKPSRVFLAMLVGAAILIIGYGTASFAIYGVGGVPTEVIGDTIQGAAGIVLGMLVSPLLKRATKQYRPNED